MQLQEKQELIDYLKQFITEARWTKMQRVLQQRTRRVTVVLEDIYQPHNASAVLRSCDGFGVQDVHVVENRNPFDLSKGVTVGSEQWLTLHRYNQKETNNTQQCLSQLKARGYQLVATTPHERETTLNRIPVDGKVAVLFGAELTGLSEAAIAQADIAMRIPMVGFSESFNISVSAALCLYDLTTRLRQQTQDWGLSEEEKADIQLQWLRQSRRASQILEQKFRESR